MTLKNKQIGGGLVEETLEKFIRSMLDHLVETKLKGSDENKEELVDNIVQAILDNPLIQKK